MKHFLIYFIIVENLLLHVNSGYEIHKYCREKERLIVSEEFDEYLLVEAVINSTLLLECRFCDTTYLNQESKMWYWQDRYLNSTEREVNLGMESNTSLNRIYMNSDLSLVIREVHFSDAGVYRCHGVDGQEAENKYNYRIEPVFENLNNILNIQRGNITEWEKYREMNFQPVNLRFSISKMKELALLRENGVILEVISEWGPWSMCENCINNYGTRTSRTLCRIKRKINATYHGNSSIVDFFRKSPVTPCRSFALAATFPVISRAVRHLPAFILEEKCQSCKKIKKIKKFAFKYKRRYVLREGSHFVVSCPESNVESNVLWRKDGLIMKKGSATMYQKKGKRSKTVVDAFSTLYLIEVTSYEEGNYTCYVNGENMMILKVVVVSKSKLLNKAFFRHSKYLGFILLLTSFCYCAGLVKKFQQRDLKRDSYIKLDSPESDDDIN